MNKIYNLLIVFSFIGLWLTSIIPDTYEVILGFILIFSFGMLHGSNDMLLIDVISNKKRTQSFLKVIAIYIATVLAAATLFIFIPALALVLFILFSAYHFGEQHWESKSLNVLKWHKQLFYFIYGLFVLFLLFVLNSLEVIQIIKSISNIVIGTNAILIAFCIIAAALLGISLYLTAHSVTFKLVVLKEFFYLVVFAIVFKVSTLIWGFALYFIIWHSFPSLYEQIHFIYGRFTKKTIIAYIKKALPYWLVSIVALFSLIYIFGDTTIPYGIIFAFIAAVTFPHALVIKKMFEKHKTPNS
ncbi:Brp/Blh family beta-carotene 15,15'-dioxygenase [Bizionia sediminis]|uniref:Probable beta-carotene 15,15'-dioxygenase n=1 Tax=Bizionia sediminis TaxID=1737064 RepID=A0ABW5KP03_9FLAO